MDVACHRIDAVVHPVVFEVVEVLHLTSATVEFQQTSERHDAHFVSETERGTILEGLGCHDGVGGLYDVVEQVSLIELHDATCLWGCRITEIPVDVDDFPEVVALFGGEEVPHVLTISMTLHVGDDVEDGAHEGARTEILIVPIGLVVEESTAEAFGMGVFLLILIDDAATVTAGIFETLTEIVVEVVLIGLAHIIVHLHFGVEGGEFLTLCSHAEDAANHHGAACIDFSILATEDFGEIFGHAATNAVMLLLTDVGEFAKTPFGGGDEAFELRQCFLAEGCEFAKFVGTTEHANDAGVVVLIDEPT